jgi:spermidine dehydrogenase
MEVYKQPPYRADWDRWLDSMTYMDFLTREMGLSEKVAGFLNPQTAAMGCGLGADVISAYSAYEFIQPGVAEYKRHHGWGDVTDDLWLASFPGGNTGILRHFVKRLIPDAIEGGTSLSEVTENRINFDALDRPGRNVRCRLSSLVVDVRQTGGACAVTFHRDGGLHKVTGKKVVMAGQQHTNKRIVQDLPAAHREAMDTFFHSPMLVVNVAIRNWRFAEKLGASSFRWFGGGFGWHTALRRQMIIDGKAPMPLHPDKPTVLTMYIPFLIPGMPGPEQAVAARMRLFSMSFRDIETRVRDQFQKMFGDYGFDAGRDIAGIITNRWGHAYVVSPPGFYFGRNGRPAPCDVIREPVDNISFGHSELTGAQLWQTAASEGQRAARQALGVHTDTGGH